LEVKPVWHQIRDLRIRINLPEQIVVVNTFTKIVRPKKNGASDDNGSGIATPLGSTIAYREYVSFSGAIGIAWQTNDGAALPEILSSLLPQINYFGKRGGFMQLRHLPTEQSDSEVSNTQGWIDLTEDQSSFQLGGTLQVLDDCGAKLTFDQVNIYNDKRMTLGKDRIVRHVVLPVEMARSSRGYTLYKRI
jgi:hypothetical protein